MTDDLTAAVARLNALANIYGADKRHRQGIANLEDVRLVLSALEAAQADALRYRWLRDPPGDWWNTYTICAQDEALFGDKADAAIDAAIAKVPK